MNLTEPKKVAKAALFNEKNQLLILTRANNDVVRPGLLDFPGGAIDEGESPDQAVLREIQEEIGVQLSASDVQLVYAYTSYYDNRSTVRFVYVGKMPEDSTITLSHEHEAFEWMDLDEALNKYDHPVYTGAVKYLLENNQLSL